MQIPSTPTARLGKRHRMQWGLRERIAAALAALLVTATATLCLLLAAHARSTHLALARDSIDALSSQMARELSLGMDRFAREIQLQASRPTFADGATTAAQMRRELEAIQKVYPEFSYISVVDVATSTVIAATGGIFEGGSAQGRPIFEQGQKSLFVADVHDAVRLAGLLPRPPSGEPLRFLDVAAPVLAPDGKPIRVLAAHLSWEWTRSMKEQVLAPVEQRRKVQILLADTSGRVVLAPDAAIPVGKPLVDVLGAAAASADSPWQDGRNYLRAEAATFATGAFPGLGWRVVARQPIDTALAGADQLRSYLLVGGLALGLVSALIGWLLAARIVQPVTQLARDAAALAPGANLPAASRPEPHEIALVRNAFQRVAGDALARAEQLMLQLDAIYLGAPVGLCVVGSDLRYARANEVWSEAFGFEADGGLGSVRFQDQAPPPLVDAVNKVFEIGTAWATEVATGTGTTERFWQTVLAPVRGPDDRIAAVSVVATEVTEMRRAEHALRLADQRKTQFIAMLAHELRNPLAPVVNALAVLKRSPNEAQAQRLHAIIDKQVARMVRLIDDLLDVSRVSLGKVKMRSEDVSVAELCEGAVESVQDAIHARGQVLRTTIATPLPVVRGDKVRLEQIVCNLLANASKYGHEGGRISLTAVQDGGCIRIVVEDDGRGIPAEFLPHVFDLFAQGDVSLDRTEGGLGIGLSLVKNLAELHGGTVHARSDGPDRGSTFTVVLPAASTATLPLSDLVTDNVARSHGHG